MPFVLLYVPLSVSFSLERPDRIEIEVGKENKENRHIGCESGLLGACCNRRIVYNIYNQNVRRQPGLFSFLPEFPLWAELNGIELLHNTLGPSHSTD